MRWGIFLGFWSLAAGCDGGAGRVPDAGFETPDAEVVSDSGAPETPDAGARDAGAAPERDAEVGSVGYAEVFATVLYPRCGGCHNAGAMGRAPDVGSYEALVTAISAQVPAMQLVVPGDADASYLFHKIDGTHADVCAAMGVPPAECGSRMPRGIGALPLDPDEIALVRAWIESGAGP